MTLKRLVAAFLVFGSLSTFAQGPREECPRGRRGNQCRARQAQQQQRTEPVVAQKQTVTPENLVRPASERTSRLDFTIGTDIKGQLNKAGGVYLYNRKELSMRTMINKPDNFRSEIVNPD